jgi:hypothetical protein
MMGTTQYTTVEPDMAGRYSWERHPRALVQGAVICTKPHRKVLHTCGRMALVREATGASRIKYHLYVEGHIRATHETWKGVIYQTRQSVGKLYRKARPERRIGEITAYRVWKLVGDILTPVTRETDIESWEGPVGTAEIRGQWRNASTAGLYAAKLTSEEWMTLHQNYHAHVVGIVGLWGEVHEHQYGYRSTKQIIRQLSVLIPMSKGLRKALEDRYQCRVVQGKIKTEWG